MKKVNCAIYVRKSTEKGLELEFNSLHNQEEACKNYILSQSFNNWDYYRTYIDGGISGGTMERPALQEMLRDIKANNIQVVVVYKVDRLSRSISDFHNMMKELEVYNCNFVSITQAFDTSTSMGKLTLNMLLSFAQFEREVSSERVRDKIRAQKSKGFWTGGNIPLGYDVIDKKLIINPEEAEQIRYIYETCLHMNSLQSLKEKVFEKGIRVKQKKSNKALGKEANILSTAVLNRILRDPIYIGKIRNKKDKEVYQGLHQGIIEKMLFNAVQEKLTANNSRGNSSYSIGQYLLHNKIMDTQGNIFRNQKSSKNKKFKYRYYCLKGVYLPAGDIEEISKRIMQQFLASDMKFLPDSIRFAFKQVQYSDALLQAMVEKIVYQNKVLLYFIPIHDVGYLQSFTIDRYINEQSEELLRCCCSEDGRYVIIEQPISLRRNTGTNRYGGRGTSIVTKTYYAHSLIKALAYAWRYKKLIWTFCSRNYENRKNSTPYRV